MLFLKSFYRCGGATNGLLTILIGTFIRRFLGAPCYLTSAFSCRFLGELNVLLLLLLFWPLLLVDVRSLYVFLSRDLDRVLYLMVVLESDFCL